MSKNWNPQKSDFLLYHPLLRGLVWCLAFLPANTWTLLRFFGLPIIYWCSYDNEFVLWLYIFLALTDMIDGLVARGLAYFPVWQHSLYWLDPFYWPYRLGVISYDRASKAGIWFDPLADKIFIISIFWYLGFYQKEILMPLLFWLMVVTELSGRAIVGLFHYHKKQTNPLEIKANYLGKIKYSFEVLTGLLLIVLLDQPSGLTILVLTLAINIFLLPSIIVLSFSSTMGHIFIKKYEKLGLYAD